MGGAREVFSLQAYYLPSLKTLKSLVVPSMRSDHYNSALSVSTAFDHFIFNLIMHPRVQTLSREIYSSCIYYSSTSIISREFPGYMGKTGS